MKSVSEIVPVTVVQEVFTPSDEVKTLVGRLMEGEPDLSGLLLRTSARRVINRPAGQPHPRFRFAKEFRQADQSLDTHGRRVLMLGNQAVLAQHSSGRSRLILPPRNQEQLDELVSAMDVLPSREEDPADNFLYVQFARDCLIQDLDRRAEELERLDARLRHPGMRPFMSVSRPRIVMQDVSIRSS
jgi:hypothetical protein